MTKEAQRTAIAELMLDAIIARDGMKLFQQVKGTEGYRGIDLSGWWIYEREDGSLYGTNHATAKACRDGNIEELAKRYNFPSDLNAMHEVVQLQPDWVKKAMRFWLFQLCDEMTAHEATAAQRAEALLRATKKYIE